MNNIAFTSVALRNGLVTATNRCIGTLDNIEEIDFEFLLFNFPDEHPCGSGDFNVIITNHISGDILQIIEDRDEVYHIVRSNPTLNMQPHLAAVTTIYGNLPGMLVDLIKVL